jgi:hypothetical protein
MEKDEMGGTFGLYGGMRTGFWYGNLKVHVHHMTCLCRHRGEAKIQLQPFHNPALEGGGWSAPFSNYITLGKNLGPNI